MVLYIVADVYASNGSFVLSRLLKWYYAQFLLQKLDCNCYIFQKIAIYNGE